MEYFFIFLLFMIKKGKYYFVMHNCVISYQLGCDVRSKQFH